MPEKRVAVAGVEFDALCEEEVVTFILDESADGRGGLAVTANLDHLKQLSSDGPLGTAYDEASLVLADGQPVVWASRLQGEPLPERVPGSSLLWTLTSAAADARRSVSLIGGADGAAESAASALQRRSPHLQVDVVAAPQVADIPSGTDVERVGDLLSSSRSSIVYLAFGCPKQELLGCRLRERFPEKWFLGVGAGFEMAGGHVRRAPAGVQRVGMEWAWRMAMEPRRLARRYLLEDMPYAPRLFGNAIAHRGRRRLAAYRRPHQRGRGVEVTPPVIGSFEPSARGMVRSRRGRVA